jgi:hypothetical protein
MIIDDIRKALDAGRIKRAAELFMALRYFLEHPDARTGLPIMIANVVSHPAQGFEIVHFKPVFYSAIC